MKKSGLALALLLVAPACRKLEHHISKARAKLEHYTTYTNKDFHFSVETPRQARTADFHSRTLDGFVDTQTVKFDDSQKPGRIAVWVTPMPFADAHKYTPKRMFDFEVGKLLPTIAGRISHQQNVTVNGVRGREIEATGNANADILSTLGADSSTRNEKRDMPVSALIRMFYRNATLYQVIAVYPTSASGTGAEAKRVVRSFKPIALPKLTRGIGEVSGLTCRPTGGKWAEMNPRFSVKLEKHLKPGDEIRVQAWCHYREKDGDMIAGDSDKLEKKAMDELRRHGKVEATALIRMWAVWHAPDICQWSFRVRSGGEDRASLGDFCWTDTKVTTGRCGM